MDHEPRARTADLREEARAAAAEAAGRAEVRITDVHELEHLRAISALFDEVWGRDPSVPSIMAPELLRAMEHAGNQVTAAFRQDRIVAATAALLGRDDRADGPRLHLHSHVTGVAPEAQGQGVGWALKQYQRSWCLDRDITTVRWTFDPLIRRNAIFNLVKLGARVVSYLEDVYGPMHDARNAGLPTDRVVASWDLTDRRVALASRGRFAEPRPEALRGSGAVAILEVGDDRAPVTRTVDPDARLVLAQIPPDIEGLRHEDPEAAQRWGHAFRGTAGTRIAAGYRVTGVTRDGWYVLGREDHVEELTT